MNRRAFFLFVVAFSVEVVFAVGESVPANPTCVF